MKGSVSHCGVAAIAAIVLGAAVAGSAVAAKFNKKVDVGSPAPEWRELPGVDGKTHSLDDYRTAKILVIAFTCNHCPIAQLYEDRFIHFAKEHKPRNVAFVAINCSVAPTDTLEKMKDRAREKRFTFPYVFDPTQKTGRSYGATVTPQLFVLDQDRKIAYMGKFDDSIEPEKVQQEYVAQAVKALLSGKKPPTTETFASGCGIEYAKFE